MIDNIIYHTKQQRGMILDPRTKLLLLFTVSTLVLGGLASDKLPFILLLFCALPFVLLFLAGRVKQAIVGMLILALANMVAIFILPNLSGLLGFIVLGSTGIFSRVLPGVMMGIYAISTTTVSEFTEAMQKLHVSEKIIIPLSVMFRFFPTVKEEFASINAAMRMRGIRFGGGRIDKMIEYRLIPLMTCSAKIGEELSAAALTRGLGGEIRRTNLCSVGLKFQDYFFIVLCATALIATVLAHIGLI